MSLSPGSRLGPYEISDRIGAGAMGEVYRARDTRLGREVAIKILPANLAGDSDRVARFEREARTLASLNHPHIAQVYGLEQSGGTCGLVMELVPGDDLAARLRQGAIPVADALAIARQIADALEAAHSLGIIHRDLKPANLKVRPDGTVKVLDFCLAKALDPVGFDNASDGVDASTMTSPVMTRYGVVLGTAGYMSPEQARGHKVDRRTDVWSFGVVLYEMLTGKRLFGGDSVADVLTQVMTAEPNWAALPSNTPSSVRRLLRRCLERDPGRRLRDIADARLELDADDALEAATAVALLAGAAIGYVAHSARGSVAPSFQFATVPPDGTSFAIADSGGAPALSPDGRSIAFAVEGATGRSLWIQSVGVFDARPLAGTEGAYGPFWSPDGQWIAFLADGNLKKVAAGGGQPLVIAPASTSASATTGTWHSSGTILFGSRNELFTVSANGGDATQVTTRDAGRFEENHYHPYLLPDGAHYLMLVRGGPELTYQLTVGRIGSTERRVLLTDVTGAQYSSPVGDDFGYLLFVRNGTLLAQAFDPQALTLSGASSVVAQDVGMNGYGSLGDFSVSPSGVLAYRRSPRTGPELAVYDRSGRQVGAIGVRPGNPRSTVRFSPDGTRAAFTRQSDSTQDIWIANLSNNAISRLTLEGGRTPAWSPDGSQIAFLRGDTIYRKPVQGGAESAIWSGPGILSVNDWSGDNRYLLITRWDTKQGYAGRGVWLVSDPLTSGTREATFITPGLHPQFVPNIGAPRWVSYDSGGQTLVATMPGAPAGKWQVSTDGANGTRWRPDGREAFLPQRLNEAMLAVDVDTKARDFTHGMLRPLFPQPRAITTATGQYGLGYDVSPDGQRFLTTLPASEAPSPAIHIVSDWRSLVKR